MALCAIAGRLAGATGARSHRRMEPWGLGLRGGGRRFHNSEQKGVLGPDSPACLSWAYFLQHGGSPGSPRGPGRTPPDLGIPHRSQCLSFLSLDRRSGSQPSAWGAGVEQETPPGSQGLGPLTPFQTPVCQLTLELGHPAGARHTCALHRLQRSALWSTVTLHTRTLSLHLISRNPHMI